MLLLLMDTLTGKYKKWNDGAVQLLKSIFAKNFTPLQLHDVTPAIINTQYTLNMVGIRAA